MGLDVVEMVMAFEEEFGFDIADAAAEKLRTPRQVIDFLCERLRAAQTAEADGCPTQQCFYRVRRALMELTGRPRRDITPSTSIGQLFPGRRLYARDWQKVRDAVAPAGAVTCLFPPRWFGWFLLSLAIVIFGLCFWLRPPTANLAWLGVSTVMVLAAVVFALILIIILIDRGVVCGRMAARYQLLRDLVPMRPAPFNSRSWTREDVAARVRKIVLEQLGIAESKYSEDADFIRDFGAG